MDTIPECAFHLVPDAGSRAAAEAAGFRLGAKGTHTSRTIMLAELEAVLAAAGAEAARSGYATAIIGDNCLSKPTAATRRLSCQRLRELYGLDPLLPLFRVLRRLWDFDPASRPLLALLSALARDPLLAATAPAVVPLPVDADLPRGPMRAALRRSVGERLNEEVLEKTCRNAASSWTQSGHLKGRTFKRRRRVEPSAAAVAFALWLAGATGSRGVGVFASAWLRPLDCSPSRARGLALEAKRLGLIDLRMAGDVVELDTARLDPVGRGR